MCGGVCNRLAWCGDVCVVGCVIGWCGGMCNRLVWCGGCVIGWCGECVGWCGGCVIGWCGECVGWCGDMSCEGGGYHMMW